MCIYKIVWKGFWEMLFWVYSLALCQLKGFYMWVTNWEYKYQGDAKVKISGKHFSRGWKMWLWDLNMHWTSERGIQKAKQGAEK